MRVRYEPEGAIPQRYAAVWTALLGFVWSTFIVFMIDVARNFVVSTCAISAEVQMRFIDE